MHHLDLSGPLGYIQGFVLNDRSRILRRWTNNTVQADSRALITSVQKHTRHKVHARFLAVHALRPQPANYDEIRASSIIHVHLGDSVLARFNYRPGILARLADF
jgi:hypothetical protein